MFALITSNAYNGFVYYHSYLNSYLGFKSVEEDRLNSLPRSEKNGFNTAAHVLSSILPINIHTFPVILKMFCDQNTPEVSKKCQPGFGRACFSQATSDQVILRYNDYNNNNNKLVRTTRLCAFELADALSPVNHKGIHQG